VNLFQLTRELINIPSVTGDEAAVTEFVSDHLKRLGFQVREQTVAAGRKNILASASGNPKVLLCTHLDTVPPIIPASEDEEHIYGRGACDAKGILAAMITAGARLLEKNVRDFGLLFLVGEETDSRGAKAANTLDVKSKYIIVGEPTENKLGAGHKGLIAIKLTARGRAAHSAFPELGDSAIVKLLDTLHLIRNSDFGADPILGTSLVNIGTLAGGVAHNVIADHASAELSIRNTVASEQVLAKLKSLANGKAEIEVLTRSEPQKLHTLPGFEQVVLPFGTDIPHLKNFGRPLLIGPGSATVAHTESERIEKRQLTAAVDIYVNLVQKLLAEKTCP
jgi:acetylornithine deacetylase